MLSQGTSIGGVELTFSTTFELNLCFDRIAISPVSFVAKVST